MKNKKVLFITQAAVIAALYVVLTLIANAFGLANYAIQVRFSEALTILPFFTAAAIPGLFVGCVLSNIITGCALWDIVFGSLATLIGAVCTYLIAHGRKKETDPGFYPAGNLRKWLSPIPPIIANMVIVPQVLIHVYELEGTLWFFTLTVGAGEVISCFVLGMILLFALDKRKEAIFRVNA
ncbi:MAG: QueT transporter family protein [Lachnospiraceae bacterium]|nr:QueT transporter family protein [Lachnospiraceae bacterium]